jgi:hypothetical protein
MTGAAFARRSVRATNLSYASLAEWHALVCRIGSRIAPSRSHYDRCSRLYRSLRIDDIRSSRNIPALEACERLFHRARGAADIPPGRGLQRELTRAEISALLVETRNRLDALRNGRADRPRSRGPRFDPARIPDAALERLIQRHPHLDTVDRLRAERVRRLAKSRPGASPAPVPAGKAREEEGREGFVTGLPGRETAPACPSQESPP